MAIHQPVLLNEVLEMLAPKPGEIVVDGTLGLGGHAEAFLSRIQPNGRLIGMDVDAEALALAQTRLKKVLSEGGPEVGSMDLLNENFANIASVMERLKIKGADIIFLDLGVSSLQLDRPERGFTFNIDCNLDMRMSLDNPLDAKRIVNEYTQEKLMKIFEKYGEENFSKRIARYVCEARDKKPMTTTFDLVSAIKRALPGTWQKIHPATRIFQALRIEVNNELENVKKFLDVVPTLLNPNGRLGVISFHSLEDRLVKGAMKEWYFKGQMEGRTRKPITPGHDEVQANPRARSAKFRVAVKYP